MLLLPAASLARLVADSSIGLTCLTLYVQFCAPDDGRKSRLKLVERLTEINKLWKVASCWLYSENLLLVDRVYCCSCLVCVILCVFVVLCVYCFFYFKCRTAGYRSVLGRSCDRPTRHRFFLFSLCLKSKCWDGNPRFQVATTCFSCSPPDLNLVVTNFMFCLHVK